jgi:hypothetical protein
MIEHQIVTYDPPGFFGQVEAQDDTDPALVSNLGGIPRSLTEW